MKHYNLFVTWLLSYIIILLITLLLSIFAYSKALHMIESEITKAHEVSLRQLQKSVDQVLENIENMSIEIIYNDRNRQVINLGNQYDAFARYVMYNLVKDFKMIKVANGSVDDFFVYYKNTDIIISHKGKFTSKAYYDFYHANENVSYDTWLKTIKRRHVKEYIKMYGTKYGGKIKNSTAFLQSIPLAEKNFSSATVVMLLDNADINDVLAKQKWTPEGMLLIADGHNNMIASTDDLGISEIELGDLDRGIYKKIGDEMVKITYVNSEVNDWKYIAVLPKRIFLEKVKYTKRIISVYMFFCLFIGGMISYYFAKRNYNPIQKITTMLEMAQDKSQKKRSGGYDYIQNAISRLIQEQKEIDKRLEGQKKILRNSFLKKLMKGKVDDDGSIVEVCKSYGLSFDTDQFAVMVFYIEDLDMDQFEKYIDNETRIFSLIEYIIANIIEDLIGPDNSGYMCEIDDMLVCVINFSQRFDTTGYKDELLRIGREASILIAKHYDVCLKVSVSELHKGFEGIVDAYQQAFDTMEYMIFLGKGQLIHYSDIKKSDERKSYTLDIQQQKKFINSMKANDFESAKHILNGLIETNFGGDTYEAQLIKCRMYALLNLMVQVLEEKDIEQDKIKQLTQSDNIHDMCIHMNKTLDDLHEGRNRKQKHESTLLVDNIKAYINENYYHPDLSAGMIAQHFDMSNVHLSRMFKMQAKKGVLEYIHEVRLTKAKELLEKGDLSIKDIAKQTGYYSSIAFIRVFKKYEGITPGNFKKMV
ncbi:MAG: AraC family transcriptional regulator [Firmicutes bacterium]|nr:AraC family transcriptional regulator [Bacillota bacterium]